MTKRQENIRIAKKEKEFEEISKGPNKFLSISWKRIKKYYKYMINWYFCFKPKDNGDLALHIILMLFVDAIILRFFGII